MGRSFVLAIGVNEYHSDRIPDLSWAAQDARDFYQAAMLGRDSSSVESRLLINHQATTSAIREALGEWLAMANPDDNIVAFFAGHGAREIRPGGDIHSNIESYLLPSNADIDHIYSTSFSLTHELPIVLRRIRASNVTMILDCCLSGGARISGDSSRQRGLDGPNFERLNRISDVALNAAVSMRSGVSHEIGDGASILMACGAHQSALESDKLGHGVFTHHLLRVMGEQRKQGRFSVSLGEIYAEVVKDVVTYTNAAQIPVLEGRLADQRLFLGF